MPETLMTPEDAARRLAVSPKTLRQWLRTGRLRGVKAGRLWRLREEDLAAFLVVPLQRDTGKKISAWSLLGKYPRPDRTVEDFMREKAAEVEEEEKRWEEKHRQ
jgi:excisionase family DNA binding protein